MYGCTTLVNSKLLLYDQSGSPSDLTPTLSLQQTTQIHVRLVRVVHLVLPFRFYRLVLVMFKTMFFIQNLILQVSQYIQGT